MNRNVLIIDDDSLIRSTFSEVLKNNFLTYTAESFDKAMEIIRNSDEPFPVIFIDIDLSASKDGIEIAAIIKKFSSCTKFVFITGGELDFEKAKRLIGSEFLFMKKPFNFQEIQQQTEALLLSWHRQQKLQESRAEMIRQKKLIVSSTEDGIIEVDLSKDGIIAHANQACCDILGYTKEELQKHFFRDISLYCQDNSTTCKKLLNKGIRKIAEDVFVRKDGNKVSVSSTIIPIVQSNGGKNAIIVFQDRSQAKEYERNLEQTVEYWQNIFGSIEDIIIVFDEKLNIIKMNKTAHTMIPRNQVDEIKYFSLTKGSYNTSLERIVLDTIKKGESHTIDSSLESTFPVLDGKYFIVSTYLVENPAGEKEVILTLRDITQRKNMEDRLRELSIKDSLTGLYNRRYFANALTTEHKRALRSESEYACIMLDLDFFKKVNDNYGHEFGDFVIKEFAIIMQRELRTTDIIARFGGEEFIILLPDTNVSGALTTATKILNSTRNHVFDNGKISRSDIRVSIGLASVKAIELENSNQIISIADKKLYEAKNAGRDQVKY